MTSNTENSEYPIEHVLHVGEKVFIIEEKAPSIYPLYESRQKFINHTFIIRTDSTNENHFLFNCIELERGDRWRVVAMNHAHHPDYAGQGIPQAMIRFISRYFKVTIVSSEPAKRSNGASKVWKRLVDCGEAEFNDVTDIYTYYVKAE